MPVQGERNMRPSSPAGFGRQGVTATEQDSNSSSQEAMSVLPSPRWVTAWVNEVGAQAWARATVGRFNPAAKPGLIWAHPNQM